MADTGQIVKLGVVDDMSGPFVLTAPHRLDRRMDAGALASSPRDK